LQILDLKTLELPLALRIGHSRCRQVERAVAGAAGGWTLMTADGGLHDARLVGGWILSRGTLIGLRWRTAEGLSLAAVTSVRVLTPDIGRRLLTRLRWPLPEPAAFA